MRKEQVEFYEVQRMRQWWIWLIMIGVNAPFIWGCIQQLLLKKPWGTNPMGNVELIVVTAVTLLLTVMLLNVKLHTYINQEGVYVRFFPFHFRYKLFDWESIAAVQVAKYNPHKAGGWGIKFTLDGTRYYTMAGKMCLSMTLQNRKKVVVGTQQPIEMEEALWRLGKIERIENG